MAEYIIAWGGQRTHNLDWQMYPSVAPGDDDYIQPDHRSASCMFSPTFTLDYTGPHGSSYMEGGSPAQRQFFETLREQGTPLAVGDILTVQFLPKWCRANSVTLWVYKPVAGIEFDIKIKGTGLGGALNVATGVSGATEHTEHYDLYAINGGPAFFSKNDQLQLVFTALPPEGLDGFGMHIATELYEPLMDRSTK